MNNIFNEKIVATCIVCGRKVPVLAIPMTFICSECKSKKANLSGKLDCSHSASSCYEKLIQSNEEDKIKEKELIIEELNSALQRYMHKFGDCGDCYEQAKIATDKLLIRDM